MIQTKGKRNLEADTRAKRERHSQELLSRRPTKPLAELTPKEKQAAIDLMLEWWLSIQ